MLNTTAPTEEYWTGELGEKMEQESIENANIHLAGLVRRGARLLTANKPIEHPEEVAGLKLPLPENATWDNDKAKDKGMTYLYGKNWQRLYQ